MGEKNLLKELERLNTTLEAIQKAMEEWDAEKTIEVEFDLEDLQNVIFLFRDALLGDDRIGRLIRVNRELEASMEAIRMLVNRNSTDGNGCHLKLCKCCEDE